MAGSKFGSAVRRFFVTVAFTTIVVAASYGQALPPAEADVAARLASSPRHGEWVRYDAGQGDEVDAWVVYPQRADAAPVVVVIHEIFGLNDWARAVADQYAAEGFIAIAPDFLSGKASDMVGGTAAIGGADAARAAMAKLDPSEILRRLDGAAAYATSLPSATKAFGSVGFCWGGGISFAWATRQPKLGAAVVYYGTSPATSSLATVEAPVLGLYGGADARVNATIPDAKAELERLGKRYETEIYEGAGHAFLRQQSGQNGANLVASEAAWPRSVAFLKAALETKSTSSISNESALLVAFSAADDCAGYCDPVDITVTGPAAALPAALTMSGHGH
jgi:carboxymethylenebutenolidase